ncbi:MAG: hypothetical protein MUF09_08535 [Candidatus Nanopelagicales bacterium]|nr:hypothetical protein [Candidatus Nanopelagicales bacterium]
MVRARHPELAAVAAAAVLRLDGLHVLGVIPGNHRPVTSTRPLAADQLAAAHPQAYAAATAVLDSHLAELGTTTTAPQPGPADRAAAPGLPRQRHPSRLPARPAAAAGIRSR